MPKKAGRGRSDHSMQCSGDAYPSDRRQRLWWRPAELSPAVGTATRRTPAPSTVHTLSRVASGLRSTACFLWPAPFAVGPGHCALSHRDRATGKVAFPTHISVQLDRIAISHKLRVHCRSCSTARCYGQRANFTIQNHTAYIVLMSRE